MTAVQFVGYLVAELICLGGIFGVGVLGALHLLDWWSER